VLDLIPKLEVITSEVMSLIIITFKLNLYKIKELTKKQLSKEKQLKIFVFIVKIKS